ncbi:hypothetical protein SEUCBS140593_003125 [Sporothrix eucalyptigena]|uniref:Uncharacterized protein n=1 Tax=Sporothrix eucalyptigena TaxID=1812306 RepID=A0ABP0BC48_9PEZI
MVLSAQSDSKYRCLTADAALILWTVFIEKVHPLAMVVHAPTVKRQLFPDTYRAYLGPLDSLGDPSSLHALWLAIYA